MCADFAVLNYCVQAMRRRHRATACGAPLTGAASRSPRTRSDAGQSSARSSQRARWPGKCLKLGVGAGDQWLLLVQRERTTFMKAKTTTWKRRKKSALVVARASGATWVVAFSRRVIPGALFRTQDAALTYAATLARAAGLRSPEVTVLA